MCLYVSCWGTSLVFFFIGPSEKRFQASFEAVSLTQPVISGTRLTSCPQSKVILLTQSHRLVMTTLSFLDYLAGLCFLSMSDFTHCCYASLLVDTFNFKQCQLSIIPPPPRELFSSLQRLQAVFDITLQHPDHKILNKKPALCFRKVMKMTQFNFHTCHLNPSVIRW